MNFYHADIDRYRTDVNESSISLILRHQGLWALGVYRFFHPLVTHKNGLVSKIARLFGFLSYKWIEIVSGISLNPRTVVGPGLYIGHFGNIIIHPNAKIGSNCVIMHGVTIGNSGKVNDSELHVPHLGNRVYVGTGAVVTGFVTLGDDCVVGANAVVNKSLSPRAVALGAPAEVVSHKGSFQYVHYRGMDEDEERLASLKLAKQAATQALVETQPLHNSDSAHNMGHAKPRDTATMQATMGSNP